MFAEVRLYSVLDARAMMGDRKAWWNKYKWRLFLTCKGGVRRNKYSTSFTSDPCRGHVGPMGLPPRSLVGKTTWRRKRD